MDPLPESVQLPPDLKVLAEKIELGEEKPSNTNFSRFYSSEKNAIAYLFHVNFFYNKNGERCMRKTKKSGRPCKGKLRLCYSGKQGDDDDAGDIFWRCGVCRKQETIRKGTILYMSKFKPSLFLQFAFFWLHDLDFGHLESLSGSSSATISIWIDIIRRTIAHDVLENPDECLVGGDGVIVEIDETKFGKRKYNRGHRVEGVWVLVAVERTEERRLFASSVEKRDRVTLTQWSKQEHVEKGSIVYTDGWRGYNTRDICAHTGVDIAEGHKRVNHSRGFKAPDGTHTNTVEGTNCGLKQTIKYSRRTKGKVDLGLLEFIWRRKYEQYPDRMWRQFWHCLSSLQFGYIVDEEDIPSDDDIHDEGDDGDGGDEHDDEDEC
jgi:IS1 family transposase